MAPASEVMFGAFRDINFQFTTPFYAAAQASVLGLMYVGSLYVNASPFPRNHPITIRKRFQAVSVVCLLAPIMVFLWSAYHDEASNVQSFPLHIWLGLHSSNILFASVFPLVLTIMLFLGPLLQNLLSCYEDEDCTGFSIRKGLTDNMKNIMCWRNFVLAPLTEEFVFRACMLPFIVPAYGLYSSIYLCPLFFGFAHIHHAIEGLNTGLTLKVVVIRTAFQMSYTTVFGAYSAFLFLRTGHLIGPVLCHCFCNLMGFPEFGAIASSKFPKVVAVTYVIGLKIFLLLLFPLTNPDNFSSIYWSAFKT